LAITRRATSRAAPALVSGRLPLRRLKQGASADEVIDRAEADGAPFAGSDELETWVRQGLAELG
jgi:hypothetical protein